MKVLQGVESNDFRSRGGSVTDCLPATLTLDDWQLARDAHTALRGMAGKPVVSGELAAIDSRRGRVQLDYELFSNTYLAFVLIMPHRRLVLGRQVRAEWRG